MTSSATSGDGPTAAVRRRGDRPRDHTGTSDAETALFVATERLLSRRDLREISVADIIAEAGLSRATFYFYFSSKFAVVGALLDQIFNEILDLVRPYTERLEQNHPEAGMRDGLGAAVEFWFEHRAVIRATQENWHAVPELRSRWLAIVEAHTEAYARRIDEDRADGIAPPGADSRSLAAALVWTTDHVFYVATGGADDDLSTPQQLIATLTQIWMGAIYSRHPAATAGRTGRRATASTSEP